MLDFSTIKNELFPVVAAVFSKTSSLGIKIRGLEAFVILCGGSTSEDAGLGDGLDGTFNSSKSSKPNSSSILDKYTVQEKVVPLMKAMKTKEPAVMMAALAVFRQVGKLADTDYLAMEVLPILWSFSLGPLLNLEQFQKFMDLIKSLSSRIEQEQTRKLRDLSSSNANGLSNASRTKDLMNVGSTDGLFGVNGADDVGENDFERLVLGRGATNGSSSDMLGDSMRPAPYRAQTTQAQAPVFSWSTPVMSPTSNHNTLSSGYGNTGSRAITPDHTLNSFAPLNPMSNAASSPSQPMSNGLNAFSAMQPTTPNPWAPTNNVQPTHTSYQPPQPHLNFAMPPPTQTANSFSTFSIAPPPSQAQQANSSSQYGGFSGANTNGRVNQPSTKPGQQSQKKGLDAYESLI